MPLLEIDNLSLFDSNVFLLQECVLKHVICHYCLCFPTLLFMASNSVARQIRLYVLHAVLKEVLFQLVCTHTSAITN